MKTPAQGRRFHWCCSYWLVLAASLGSAGLVLATLGVAVSVELATGAGAEDSDGLLGVGWTAGASTDAVVLVAGGVLIDFVSALVGVAGGVESGVDATLEGVELRGAAALFGALVTLALATFGAGVLAGLRMGASSTAGAFATTAGASLATVAGGVVDAVTVAGGVAGCAVLSGASVA
jgi:hypothetical protein